MKENGTISKRGYVMAQFSKFVRRGFTRVEVPKSPSNGLHVSAYKGDSNVAIVVVNTNSSTQSLSFSLSGQNVPSYEKFTTSSSKNLSADGVVTAEPDGSFSVDFDAQSVTTLHGAF